MKLLLASPCQMVIADKESGYSLIAVFHHIKVRVPEAAEIPSNALLPKEWAIFSQWQLDSSEAERNVKQVAEAYWPNGDPLFKQELKALNITENQAAFIIRNIGFPMGQNGIIKILLSMFVDDKPAFDPIELNVKVEMIKDLHH